MTALGDVKSQFTYASAIMKTRLCFALMLCSTLPIQSYAADENTSWHQDKLVITPSIGMLSSNTGEYVYENDQKLSQLDWRVSNVPVLKLSLDYTLDFQRAIYARLWTTLHKKTGSMNDYDWLDAYQSKWTDWSRHTNVPLNKAYEIDAGMSMSLYDTPQWKHDALVGLQLSRYHWSSYGGQYWYDNGDNIGSFPANEHGIDYIQKLTALYVGVATRYTHQKWSVHATLKGSPFARINDYDEHLLRDLYFQGTIKNMWYLGSNISVMYAITPRLQLTMDFAYSIFFEGRGDTEILDRSTGTTEYSQDSAAASNISRLLTFGVRYSF
jgi:plasminogen activator